MRMISVITEATIVIFMLLLVGKQLFDIIEDRCNEAKRHLAIPAGNRSRRFTSNKMVIEMTSAVDEIKELVMSY